MKKRMKQMLSGFLALTMTVGGLPTSVLAEELILDEGEESAVVSESLLAGVGEDESGNGLQIVGCEEVGQSAETELWTEVSTEIESETELWTETSTEIKTETELYLNGTETETEADFAETETEQVAEYSTLAAVKQIGFQVTPQNAKLTVQDAEGNTVSPVEGKYELTEGTEYTYTAEADGYIRISGKVDMNADGPIVLNLEKAPYLKNLQLYDGSGNMMTLSPRFNKNTKEYQAILSSSEESLNIVMSAADLDTEHQQIRLKVVDTKTQAVLQEETTCTVVDSLATATVAIPKKSDQYDIVMTLTDGTEEKNAAAVYTVHMAKTYTLKFALTPDYAAITVTDPDGKTVNPQKDGSYVLTAGIRYTYIAEASGYESVTENISVFANQLSEIPVTLVRAAGYTDVDNVINRIENIGGVSLNASNRSKEKIDAARAAYNELPEEDKLLVYNYDVLTEAEHYYNQLLEKAGLQNTDSALNWSQFLGNEEQKGVSDSKTPQTGEDLVEKWKLKAETGSTMFAHVSAPAYYNKAVYVTMDDKIYKLDPEDGEILAQNEAKGCMMLLPQVTCADGKVFAMAKNDDGKVVVKVYRSSDLEFLYQTIALNANTQIETPIMYHDGYFYLASYGSAGSYYAFIATDEKKSYDISPEWDVEATKGSQQGFLWGGAEFVGNYAYFGDTAGTFFAVNKTTGEVVDKLNLTDYQVQSTPNYYEKNRRLYLTLASGSGKGGAILSVKVNKDGTFNRDSMKWFKSDKNGGGIKSSPVIYNGRIYVCGGGGHGGSNEPFRVIDANTMTEIYQIPDLGSKGTPVLSTAYATAENNYKVYLYVVPYRPDGQYPNRTSAMYIIQDSIGQTEPIYEKVDNIGVGQFCSQSMTVGDNGLIYYYNDSNYLYAYGLDDLTKRMITATDVERQIRNLPEVNSYKWYNRTEVKRIKARYDSLSEEEQAKVTNIQKLLDILEVSKQDEIERINSGIMALPALDEMTLDSRDMIENLYQGYLGLDDEKRLLIINPEKLEMAYEKIADLEQKVIADAIVADINKLPEESQITSSSQAQIDSLLSRVEALGEDTSAITNLAKLQAAKTKVDAVIAQREALNDLIKSTLDGVTITLKNKSLIDAVDKAAEGLAKEDVFSLESYQYYVSPAKAELINAIIQKYGLNAGVNVDDRNASELQAALKEIQALKEGVTEEDQKYLKDYEQALKVQEKINAYYEKANHKHAFTEFRVVSEATVFAAEVREYSCACGEKEQRSVGAALTPTMKVNATKLPMKVKQSTSKLKVTDLAKGDSVASWKSSNTSIVKVNANGKLTAGKKAGKATVTITLKSGLQKKVQITVQKKKVTTSKISGLTKTMTLKKGQKATLMPKLTPLTSQDKLTFSSSNKKVATVTSKGVITAKKAGKAKITVKAGKKKYTVTVTVPKTKTTAINGVKSEITLKKGKAYTLKAKTAPAKSDEKLTFKSSNKKVATVTTKGKIKGLKKGTAVITITSGSVSTKCTVKVIK